MKLCYFLLIFMITQAAEVLGHGFLRNPPQRSSAWKYGYNTPPNYNHMALFCGGFQYQWSKKVGGRCGVCGDKWEGPEHNADIHGKYVKNVITGRYSRGGIIDATVNLTANHGGWFEFRLCRLKDDKTKVTQNCLNENLLLPVGSTSARIYLIDEVPVKRGVYNISLQLPPHIKCNHCVLQWKYYTGNSYGCENRHGEKVCGVGLGKQETFVNCADIQITDGSATSISDVSQSNNPTENMYPENGDSFTGNYVTDDVNIVTTGYPDHTEFNEGMYPGYDGEEGTLDAVLPHKRKCEDGVRSYLACSVRAKSSLAAVLGMDEWCCNNCVKGNCLPTLCSCDRIYI